MNELYDVFTGETVKFSSILEFSKGISRDPSSVSHVLNGNNISVADRYILNGSKKNI